MGIFNSFKKENERNIYRTLAQDAEKCPAIKNDLSQIPESIFLDPRSSTIGPYKHRKETILKKYQYIDIISKNKMLVQLMNHNDYRNDVDKMGVIGFWYDFVSKELNSFELEKNDKNIKFIDYLKTKYRDKLDLKTDKRIGSDNHKDNITAEKDNNEMIKPISVSDGNYESPRDISIDKVLEDVEKYYRRSEMELDQTLDQAEQHVRDLHRQSLQPSSRQLDFAREFGESLFNSTYYSDTNQAKDNIKKNSFTFDPNGEPLHGPEQSTDSRKITR